MQEILPPETALPVRYDGWTGRRQDEFCHALTTGSTVREACAIVGKSSTSAYKARERIAGFRDRWDEALEATRPKVEAEVYRRAVEGWDEPVFQGGRQVGVKRRYSEGLLKLMYNRGVREDETRREGCRDRQADRRQVTSVPIEEVEASLLRKLEALDRRLAREAEAEQATARAAAAVEADRMRASGLCP